MVNSDSALQRIFLALDLITTQPLDGVHSEYNGLTSLRHFLLQDGILTTEVKFVYSRMLRSWPFPPGSNHLLSSINHLASYSLSDHARWARIVPSLLRAWLNDSFIESGFVRAV